MADLSDREIRELSQRKRAQLEELRAEAQHLQGEARLPADQHMNKLSDELEELERHPHAELEHLKYGEIGLLGAIKRTWREFTGRPQSRSSGKPERSSDHRTPPM